MNLLGPVANYWMWTTKPCQDVEQKGCKFAANAKQSLVITTDCIGSTNTLSASLTIGIGLENIMPVNLVGGIV